MSRYIIVSLLPVLMVLGNSMLFPLIARLQADLHLTTVQAGLVLSAYSLPAGILIPMLGFISDRFGTVRTIVMALSLYCLGSLAAGFSVGISGWGFGLLLAGRLLQGIGAAGTTSLAMVFFSRGFTQQKAKELLGLLELSNGIGKVLAPLLGGLFLALGWYYSLYFLAFLSGLTLLLLVGQYRQQETAPASPIGLKQYIGNVAQSFRGHSNSLWRQYLLALWLMLTLFGAIFFWSKNSNGLLEGSPLLSGYLISIPFGLMALGGYLSGLRLQGKQQGTKQGVGLALVIGSCFVIVLTEVFVIKLLLISILAFGVGWLLTVLNVEVTLQVPAAERGIVTGLYNSFRFFGVALGPMVFAALMGYNLNYPFILAGSLGLTFALPRLSSPHPQYGNS